MVSHPRFSPTRLPWLQCGESLGYLRSWECWLSLVPTVLLIHVACLIDSLRQWEGTGEMTILATAPATRYESARIQPIEGTRSSSCRTSTTPVLFLPASPVGTTVPVWMRPPRNLELLYLSPSGLELTAKPPSWTLGVWGREEGLVLQRPVSGAILTSQLLIPVQLHEAKGGGRSNDNGVRRVKWAVVGVKHGTQTPPHADAGPLLLITYVFNVTFNTSQTSSARWRNAARVSFG